MEQKQLHTNFFALKFDEILWPTGLFYAIWNKGFVDHAHLTDGMQWQKSKKHIYRYIYIDEFYALDVFCESECRSRQSKGWKELCSCNENVMRKYKSFYDFNPCNMFFKQLKSCL